MDHNLGELRALWMEPALPIVAMVLQIILAYMYFFTLPVIIGKSFLNEYTYFTSIHLKSLFALSPKFFQIFHDFLNPLINVICENPSKIQLIVLHQLHG